MNKKTILIMSRGMRMAKIFSRMADILSSEFDIIVLIGNSDRYPASSEKEAWHETEHLKVIDFPKAMTGAIGAYKGDIIGLVKDAEKELGLSLYRAASNYLLYRRFNKEYFNGWDGHYDTEEEMVKEFAGSYLVLKSLFRDHRPDLVFYETIDFISTFVALALSRKIGIFSLGMNFPPCLGNDKVHFTYGTNRQSVLLDFYYKNPGYISADSYRKADDMLQDSRKGHLVEPAHIRLLKDAVGKNFFMSILRHGRWALPRGSGKYPLQIPNLLMKRFWVEKRLIKQIPDKPYVLFFLQMQPEASSTSHSSEWVDYDRIIEQLSLNAPSGVTIAVKENPRSLGVRGKRYFGPLMDLANVMCLHPSVPTVPLIQKASAVFAVTGSIGMEAILMRKKVALLGRPFYSIYTGVRKLNRPEEIFRYLEDCSWNPEAMPEELRKFIAAYLESIFDLGKIPCGMTRPEPVSGGECLAKGLKKTMELIERYDIRSCDFDAGSWENSITKNEKGILATCQTKKE